MLFITEIFDVELHCNLCCHVRLVSALVHENNALSLNCSQALPLLSGESLGTIEAKCTCVWLKDVIPSLIPYN